jgi:hypothetical protein
VQAVRTTCNFGSVHHRPSGRPSLTNTVLPVLKKTRSSGSLSTTSSLVSVGVAEETPQSEESESEGEV